MTGALSVNRGREIVIGIDFDNTLVALDSLFRDEAARAGLIADEDGLISRTRIRDRLHAQSRNDAWMDMQAAVYGTRLGEASPFEGAIDALAQFRARGARLVIVSHKTQRPLSGAPVDLHEAARAWLRVHAICGGDAPLVAAQDVFFEPTPEAKVRRIEALGCALFIDDLPSILAHSAFPKNTRAVLFDPSHEHPHESGVTRARTWDEALAIAIPTLAAPLVARAGFDDARFTSIAGGANNRVYRLESGSSRAVLKAYYAGENDLRDRLGTEWAFLEHLAAIGVPRVPRPIVRDEGARLGVYSYLEGSPVPESEMGCESRAFELVDFIVASNASVAARTADLPLASEACLSLAAHLASVDRRLARLGAIPRSSPAFAIAHDELPRVARLVREAAIRRAAELEIPHDSSLTRDACILSASDFGFHNALVTPQGALAFVDFEYAGWDDPAKLLCDLVTRPHGGVPMAHLTAMCARLEGSLPPLRTGKLETRVRLLVAVHAVKWAALALNDYLPGDASRRTFALGADDARDARRERQLAIARDRLDFAMTFATTFTPTRQVLSS